MDKAIDRLEKIVLNPGDDKESEITPLIQVLLGMKPLAQRIPVPDITFLNPDLNDSQKEAVKFCLESPEVACIHGPPGRFEHLFIAFHHINVQPSQGLAKRIP